jgi:PST family polysaccharide transporter
MNKNLLNLLSLTSIQASNAILPLLVFPYALKILGTESYSLIIISEAMMFIIYAFVVYSFEIKGVSEIIKSRDENNSEILSLIFNKVIIIRLLLLCFFCIILFLYYIFARSELSIVLLLWMLFPLSYIFQSSYFFQALEQNFYPAIFIVLSRILCIILIFNFIYNANDAYLIPLIIGMSYLIGSILSFIFAIYKFRLHFLIPSKKEIIKAFYEGKEIFLGNISVLLFKDSNILIMGLLVDDNNIISIYSMAEKFIKSLQAGIRPLNQFFFPKTIKALKNFTTPNKRSFLIVSKYTAIQLVTLLLLVLVILFLGYNKDFIPFLSDYPNFNAIFFIFILMLPSVFFGISNFMYGTTGLNHLNEEKYYAKSIFTTGIIGIVLTFMLIYFWKDNGAAISFVVSELILFLFISIKYFKIKDKKNGI